MPKSSSLGVKTMGFAVAVITGTVTVWVVALLAWAVMLPGPVPVRRMSQSEVGGSVVEQVVEVVNPVAVIWRLVAVAEPRLRRVMLGEASVESARLGAEVVGFSLERNAAEPAQALPLQVPEVRTALWRVEGSAVVGEL